jgi:hypothetical protein
MLTWGSAALTHKLRRMRHFQIGHGDHPVTAALLTWARC